MNFSALAEKEAEPQRACNRKISARKFLNKKMKERSEKNYEQKKIFLLFFYSMRKKFFSKKKSQTESERSAGAA
ncbi:hypothetical protein ACQRZG_15055 [Acetobacter pasteurianus]